MTPLGNCHYNKKKRRKNNGKNKNEKSKRQKKAVDDDHKVSTTTAAIPVIGHVLGKGDRSNLLKYMPPTASNNNSHCQWTTKGSDSSNGNSNSDNWPKCNKCNELARPAILMFDDAHWLPDVEQEQRYRLWQYALLKLCSKQQQRQKDLIKECILEIGCGMNVPTCRVESEQFIQALVGEGGAKPTLIRINPDFPLASFPNIKSYTIPIMSKGLIAIQKIDYYYNKMKNKNKKHRKK